MIKRMKYNGMYVTFISFFFTVALSTYQHYFRTDVKYYFEVLTFIVMLFYALTIFMDMVVVDTYKLVHNSSVELIISIVIVTLCVVSFFFSDVLIYFIVPLFFTQLVYRMRNRARLENLNIEIKTADIKNDLKIKNSFSVVKFTIKNLEIKVINKIKGDVISIDGEYIKYKNKKIKINMLKQIQIDLQRDILECNDSELLLAEMYSI